MTDKMPLEGCTGNPYNVEFIIDTDVRCAVRIHYFAEEDVINGQVM